MLYAALVLVNFRLSEKIYDSVVNEFFTRNSVFLHEGFKKIRKIMESTIGLWFNAIKEMLFGLLAGIIPMLPSFIREPLTMFGVMKYIEK